MHERVQKALADYCKFTSGIAAPAGDFGMVGSNKFGQILDLNPVDGRVPVWEQGTAYPYQTAPFTPSLASTSALDTLLGTGARKVIVSGNDAEGYPQEETIELAGLTPVASQLSWSSIYRMFVDTVGSTKTTQGTIYCGTGTFTLGIPAVVLVSIDDGNNQSQMCMLTVPLGYYCAITSITFTTASTKPVYYQDEIRLKDSVFDESHPFRNVRSINVDGSYSLELKPYALFPELTDVRVTALATIVNSRVECAFRYILIPKDLIDGNPGEAF